MRDGGQAWPSTHPEDDKTCDRDPGRVSRPDEGGSGVVGLVGKAGQGGWARGVKVLQHVTTQPPEKRSELWWVRAALGPTSASF